MKANIGGAPVVVRPINLFAMAPLKELVSLLSELRSPNLERLLCAIASIPRKVPFAGGSFEPLTRLTFDSTPL